ncbi:isoprenylcysteine carboxylmethyltransferase family protein [Candidatus Woesearchaeota archaeon]|nr:MAG: isoprenylcysteine carboxylmethyltransferase family protein [Candidatus Woesearchaeota archaeon]
METLEEKTERNLQKLGRLETILNFARHIPLNYLRFSFLAKPLLSNQNLVEYWTRHPLYSAAAFLGLTIAGIGVYVKSLNDSSEEMQRICENPQKEENNREMVESGMYEHMRHPCYFGQTIIALGFSLLSPGIDTAVAFAAYLGLTQKCAEVEERKNLALFSDKYKSYISRVPRWPSLSRILKPS